MVGVTQFEGEKPGGTGFQPADDDRLKTCPTKEVPAYYVRPITGRSQTLIIRY
jgi:hypothetical protein